MTTMTRFFPLGLVWLLCQGCVTTVTSNTIADEANSEEAAIANLNLGVAYYREGRFELALERLESSLDQNPRLADAHSTIALVYEQLGETDEAENHYRRATQLEPENPGAANSYAVFLCRNERWNDAERQFMRAARNPRYPTPEAAFTNAGRLPLDVSAHRVNCDTTSAAPPTSSSALSMGRRSDGDCSL